MKVIFGKIKIGGFRQFCKNPKFPSSLPNFVSAEFCSANLIFIKVKTIQIM